MDGDVYSYMEVLMISARARWLAILATPMLAVLGFASPAAATTTPFGCRASVSAIRPSLALATVEPYVANRAETPCATDSAGASSGTTGSTVGGSVVTAGPGAAYTYSSASADQTLGTVAPGATSLASVDGGTINNAADTVVLAGPAQAQASYDCVNGAVVPSASSNVSAATVNGQSTAPSSPGAEQTTQLGGGSYLTINQKVQTATSLTERLVFEHIAGVGDYVLGEAQVTLADADPCAGTTGSGGSNGGSGGGTTPATLNACPPGSTLIASTQLCEIVLPGGTDIVVSRPFEGPTGGTVVALAVARKKYRSPCLYGAGSQYAIIGTNHADRIEGTVHADRILGLGGNDRIAGQGGNDCIDGGAGNDRIYGGKGNERIYGGPGNDRISVQGGNSYVNGGPGNDRIVLGNGNDRVYGGPGNDRISVGRGNDHVWGGPGNDTISAGNGNDSIWGQGGNDSILVGTGKDHLFGGSGDNRLFGPGLVVYANCGSGRRNVAYVNVFGMHYAHTHGCQTVRKIRTHTL
jgi:Ca2+-binding RTX toxin-like protein